VNTAALPEADIVDLASDGRGIARVSGKAVFIDGALPGERVRYRLFKRRKQMDEGLTVEILVRSATRVEPKCAHYGVCGGCSLQHLAAQAQLAAKQAQLLETLERIGRVRPRCVLAPLAGPTWGYRRRARLGVKFVHKKGRVLAGFREREKPYLADIRHCEVLVERFASLPQELAALVETLSIREQLPQVEVAAGDTEAALVFRVLAAPTAEDVQKLAAFGERHAVQIHLQSGGIASVKPLRGDYPPLRYAIAADPGGVPGVEIEFGPMDFVQVNGAINAALVHAALAQLQPTAADKVLDLFCGVGNFTLPLARRAGRVTGIEGEAALVARARANALHNGIGNAAFMTGNLFEPAGFGAWAAEAYDLVLLDPPRAGARELLGYMSHWRPRRVVYISCHPGSLARDAGILIEAHGFELAAAGVMDMFPHTTHVESIAVFETRP
jgi:23S rRNA (uracil1939-C5)-methyltransferase